MSRINENSPSFISRSLTLAADLDVAAGVDDGRLEEPGEAEADQDVEDVAPDRVGHRHVAVALPATQVGVLT